MSCALWERGGMDVADIRAARRKQLDPLVHTDGPLSAI